MRPELAARAFASLTLIDGLTAPRGPWRLMEFFSGAHYFENERGDVVPFERVVVATAAPPVEEQAA